MLFGLPGKVRRMTAVVFPGQGSQAPGMGQDLFLNDTYARQVFDEVQRATDVDIAALCFESDEETSAADSKRSVGLVYMRVGGLYGVEPGDSRLSAFGHGRA